MELQLETQENDLRTRGTNKGLKGERRRTICEQEGLIKALKEKTRSISSRENSE
jgi:hypothetical protein